jgi:hypothetical protein
MSRQYRIKKIPKNPASEALPGYFLDSVYEGGDVFDSYPEYYCDMLNSESREFIYSIEELTDGDRKETAPMGSGNNAVTNQSRTEQQVSQGS